ncbi:hypothetical protein RS130_10770 [Paraglaciecola aquimarina]|uniref:Uncharacterized protein n=1 Tax=Paraglaciecola aquimarina TaxID=1235557 RepID=A0ABU3SWI1_9ALTE|nr:hypothetical protein [Paraglaciecola aquimarina]MDU0354348.1 hypothetical protein [Paraglaciecola aquimarina]
MILPETLKQRLQEYSDTGFIKIDSRELFSYESWIQVLIGQKYLKSYEKFSQPDIPANGAVQFLTNVHNAIKREVDKLPEHRIFINNLNK